MGPTLGPAVTVELHLEGQPVKALVDTRLPVTIVLIDCLLDVLAKNKKTDQTKEEWREGRERDSWHPHCQLTTMVVVR